MARASNRPLSPHLSIWRWGPAMFISILHRVTGSGLATVGLGVLLWWLGALASGPEAYATFEAQATSWYGFIAPARTPADIVQKLNQAIVASLHDAATLERLNGAAMAADPTTPQEMRAFVAQEYETWGKVVRTLKF